MTRDELKKIKYLDFKIDFRQKEVDKIKRDLTYIKAVNYSKEKTSPTNMHKNSNENIINRIIDYNKSIDNLIDEFYNLKQKAIKEIRSLKEPYQSILLLRYIQYCSWREIEIKMNYTERHIKRLHHIALEILNNIKVCH